MAEPENAETPEMFAMTPMTPDRLPSAIRAALDDTERLVGEYEAYMGERSVAAGSYVLVTPPGWGPGEPFDPDTVLRLVAAMREIVDEYEAELARGPARPMVHVAESEARHGGILDAYQHVARALAGGLGIDPEGETT